MVKTNKHKQTLLLLEVPGWGAAAPFRPLALFQNVAAADGVVDGVTAFPEIILDRLYIGALPPERPRSGDEPTPL